MTGIHEEDLDDGEGEEGEEEYDEEENGSEEEQGNYLTDDSYDPDQMTYEVIFTELLSSPGFMTSK